MKGLSSQEIKVVSELEFYKRYYFTKEDIKHHFDGPRKIKDFIYHLQKKRRIIKVNRKKYYLVPIKAKSGNWTDHPFIITDQICDSKDYFIGGWSAANYWHLTEQVPMRVDVYTTRRQGKVNILSNRIVFHRTSKKRIAKAVLQKIGDRTFWVLSKNEAKEWLKSRQ